MPVFWLLAVACLIELPLGQTTIFGEDVILWDTLFRAVAASPVLIHFYREDAVFRGKERWGWKEAALWAAAGFGLSLLATLAVQVLSRAAFLPGSCRRGPPPPPASRLQRKRKGS